MNNQEILDLKLTVSELNIILQALGKQPYEEVYLVVGKLQKQANSQLQEQVEQNSMGESAKNS